MTISNICVGVVMLLCIMVVTFMFGWLVAFICDDDDYVRCTIQVLGYGIHYYFCNSWYVLDWMEDTWYHCISWICCKKMPCR